MLDTFMEILLIASWISDCTKMENWSTRYCLRQACCGVISHARLSMSLRKCHSVYRSFMKHKPNYLIYIYIFCSFTLQRVSQIQNYYLIVSLSPFFYHKTTIYIQSYLHVLQIIYTYSFCLCLMNEILCIFSCSISQLCASISFLNVHNLIVWVWL